jgi:4-alpha-glucanotransferase
MPDKNRPRPRRRRAGVLIPLFSVRTKAGWGLGEIPDMVDMARWAAQSGIRVIQMLPVCAVSGGETSPYSAAPLLPSIRSTSAWTPARTSLPQGGRAALSAEDRQLLGEVAAAATVPWNRLRPLKERGMRLAFAHFRAHEWRRRSKRARQLALFARRIAPGSRTGPCSRFLHGSSDKHWREWPADLANRRSAALARVEKEHAEEILFVTWQQWQLDEQWRAARSQAESMGVELMGDLPFVVAEDSADVWKERKLFRLGFACGRAARCPVRRRPGLGLAPFRLERHGEDGLRLDAQASRARRPDCSAFTASTTSSACTAPTTERPTARKNRLLAFRRGGADPPWRNPARPSWTSTAR